MIAADFEPGFSCREPAWFLLLLVLPALCWWRWKRRAMLPFAAFGLVRGSLGGGLPALPKTMRQRCAVLPELLHLLAIGCVILALARPTQRLPLPPERLGRDVLLCLDTSSSMDAKDLDPVRSRHEIVGELAAEFVQQRRDDRTGLLTFARFADLRCPPTLDHLAVAELLRQVRLTDHDSAEDATGIGNAVAQAAAILRRSPAAGKVIVLMTDGEENVAVSATPQEIAPRHAAQLCAQLGIRVHTIVVGRGNQKPDGRVAPLDTTAVRELAEQTGGGFFTARDVAGLQQVYRQIDRLETVAFAEPRQLVVEWFPLPIALGVLLLAVGVWLRHTLLLVWP